MLGYKLFQLRKKHGKTQREVAKCVGIARTTYALYEQERKIPDLDTLEKLADCLQVSVEELVQKPKEDKPPTDLPKKVALEKFLGQLKASPLTLQGKPLSRKHRRLIIALLETLLSAIAETDEDHDE